MTTLHLDAEALYAELRSRVRGLLGESTVLVGIWSGGAWLAERLQRDLKLAGGHGVISSALHRDDYSSRGLSLPGRPKGESRSAPHEGRLTRATADPTHLPFEVAGRDILLVDDVLYTGRTVRAVVNELYDFGRPARVMLAVLVDRGGRELPIEAAASAARLFLPADQRLSLARDDAGRFSFDITAKVEP